MANCLYLGTRAAYFAFNGFDARQDAIVKFGAFGPSVVHPSDRCRLFSLGTTVPRTGWVQEDMISIHLLEFLDSVIAYHLPTFLLLNHLDLEGGLAPILARYLQKKGCRVLILVVQSQVCNIETCGGVDSARLACLITQATTICEVVLVNESELYVYVLSVLSPES